MQEHVMKIGSRVCTTVAAFLALAIISSAQSDVVGWGRMRFNSAWNHEPFVQVAAGAYHTLALRPDGTVVGWGLSFAGELDAPALPPGVTYTEIAGPKDGLFSLAIRSDGSAVAWGNNSDGQCNVPALPPGVTYVHVSAGSRYAVALRSDGSVIAWGDNQYGQRNVPAAPPGLTYVEVEALAGSTLVRRSDGQIFVYGYNADGQCNVPPLPPGLTYQSAGVGYFQIIALRSDGAAVAWGYNAMGQCNVPALPAGLSWVKFAGGAEHSLGLRSDGSLVAWGSNTTGQCNVPPLPPGLTYTTQMAGGGEDLIWGEFRGHSVALRSDGAVIAWGLNDYFQCNAPSIPAGLSYTDVSAGGTKVDLPYAWGEGHALARLNDGSVVAWGRNIEGQCNVPALPNGITYVEVDAGSHFYSVARRSDGQVVAWGDNSAGQCNVQALPPGLTYVEVAAGERHVLARRNDGSVVAWGNNSYGQCNVPVLPPGLAYVEVAASWRHSVARRSDGSVVAWGSNAAGQCNVPALPPGLTYVEVAAGYECTLARRSDGSVVGWGDNSFGQCNVPALPSGLSYAAIFAGADYTPGVSYLHSNTLARRSDGALIVWGDTSSGQADVPAVPPGMQMQELAAGGLFTIANVGSGPSCDTPTSYCIAAINTTGHGAHIGWQGSSSISENDLVLLASGVPPTHFGIFFFGAYHTQIPFGEGYLCVTGNQQRLMPPLQVDSRGMGSYALDFSDPSHKESQIAPGSEWNFQFWYRDPQPVGHGFNFTDALDVHFCP
jgi:alpha-tubulin suppressor-like RCC1 family protein